MLIKFALSFSTMIAASTAAINQHSSNRNEVGTLDKVKVIKSLASDRCLVIENGKRQGDVREAQLVLWKCHDSQAIKGLEQEMFMVERRPGGGYSLMGNAGSLDKCVAAERGYNDFLVIRRCNPADENQSWILRKVDLTFNSYQVVQMSTGRCVRAPGQHDGAWVRVGDCDSGDERQLWKACGLRDEVCNF